MRRFSILFLGMAVSLVNCSHTAPGTHVEVVDKEGAIQYVAGAAGIGHNQSLACEQAIGRSIGAIAIKFADKNDDIADDVAEEVGVEDGRIFLQRYAKATALDAAVKDVQFDPIEHLCVVSIRWNPPVFIKEAIRKYAEAMKQQELGGSEKQPAPAPPPTAAPAPVVAPVAAPIASPAAPPPDPCKSQRAQALKAQKANQKVADDFAECTRRTNGDERMCSRYKLYADEGQAKEASAVKLLNDCLSVNP